MIKIQAEARLETSCMGSQFFLIMNYPIRYLINYLIRYSINYKINKSIYYSNI